MILHVTINNEDIQQGQGLDPAWCPIGRALRRQTGHNSVGVWEDEIKIGSKVVKRVPRSVSRFVRRFDKLGRYHVQPFTFKLNTAALK